MSSFRDDHDDISAITAQAWREFLKPGRRAQPRLASILDGASFAEVPSGGATVACWRQGEGPAVLLVHGWSDDHTIWAPLMARLAERGRAFVTLDLPGHGLSSGEECALRMSADAVRAVAERWGPIDVVVGHSLGGLAGAYAVSEGLAADRMSIIGTSTTRLPRLARLAEDHALDDRIVAELRAVHAARFGVSDMDVAIPDFASKLDLPGLIIHSHDDECVPFSAAERTHAAWAGSSLWAVHGPGHRRTARDSAVIEKLLEFID